MMVWKNAEIPVSAADEPLLLKYWKSTEDPASMDHSRNIDILVFMVSEIVEGETTTNPSAFMDSILKHAHFFVIFAVFLVGRYGSNLPLYQWLFFASLIALLVLYLYINYAPLLLLEEDIKWVRRESRFLRSISKDADQVMDLRVLVDTRGKQILGPSFYSGGVKLDGLDETEAAWVAKIKSVVRKAQDLVEAFEKQRIRRNSHNPITCFVNVSENFKQVERLFTETKLVKEEIKNSILMQKVQKINICKSLERSRSNLRSLLDRPIIHESDQQKWVKLEGRVAEAAASTVSIVEKINSLITRDQFSRGDSNGEQIDSVNLQLLLLHYFLKDIKGVRFESEFEVAWVEEVEGIINEAKTAIDNFLERPPSRTRWLSIIDSWKARRKLKGNIACIEVQFTGLLEMKDRYGFKFVRRDSSKFVYQCPHQSTEDDKIISSVVGKMQSYANAEPNVLGEVSHQVHLLYNKLKSMHKLVDDEGMIERRYNSRMAWLVQMKIIAQRAEISVETFMKSSGIVRRRAVINLSWEVDQIKHTIKLLMRSIEAFGIEFREESSSVIGLEEDILAVVSGDSGLTTNNNCSVVCIAGIEGIGKTTLAKKIYSHGVVVEHFPCRAWVSVPVKSDDIAFLEDVGNQVLRSLKVEGEENGNASSIHAACDILKDKRYLLILDNIPTMEEWNTLEAVFPVTSNGSRILLTTRDNKVASQARRPILYQLRLRTKEESWKLFIQMVQFPPEEEKRAMKILGKCGGLPLAILRVGYLMSGKVVTTAEELEKVIEGTDMALLNTYTPESLEELHRADDDLYKCLSYLKLFPTGFEISARRLISLWIAEGLIKEKGKETFEDVADKYLSKLIDRNMIQVVERTLNGRVKSCNLPDALAKKELYMRSERFALHVNRNGTCFNHVLGERSNFPCNYSQPLLSILIFDTREGNKPGEETGFFLQKGIAVGCCRRLQILDLERVFRPDLAKMIGKLSKLRYLGLRWTCLESLPESIGELLDLQTLDVKNTDVRTLPSSIWNLQQLRHLYLDQSCRTKFAQRQQGSSSLNKLQTLWGVFVDKDSLLKDGLDKLTNLRKLKLAFQLDSSEQHALAEWIKNLKHLKSLRMRSIGEKGEPGDLTCLSLSGLHNLSSINLFGKLSPSIISEFPKNLTDLTLSASSFSDDPMPKLEELSNLKLLCFYSNSFTGENMTCSKGGFPQLMVLKLWYLEKLKNWNVEEKAMQNLRELEIRSCTNLNVPSGLRHLKTLSELKLTDMPPKFATTIEETKGQLWDDINHSPAIIAVNWR